MDTSAFSELYPFAAHYFSRDGVRQHYLDEGEGEPVVMVHGNPTWSFFFRELVKVVARERRVIVPDHVGCGMSDKPQRYPYTLGTHIDNLESLLDHLGLTGVSLVVHDWGGGIGMGWATRHPGRVRRLVVLNSAAWLAGRAPWRIRICRSSLVGGFLVRGLNGFVRAALRMAAAKPERMTPAVRAGYLAPYDSYATRVAVHRFVQDIPVNPAVPSYSVLQEMDERLPLLADKPMLICWGDQDFCFTPHFLQSWCTRFPHAKVHRFADAGHYLLEDAHERIAPIVRDFLTK